MVRGAALACAIAFAALANAHAQTPAACPPAPALTPAPEAPDDLDHPTQALRVAALKAAQDWSAERIEYGECRRAELQTMAAKVNAATEHANALIDQWNKFDAKVRAARAVRTNAMRAYAERRHRVYEDVVIASTPAGAPCTNTPGADPAPNFPDPQSASNDEMRRADKEFQSWLTPRGEFLACLKADAAAQDSAAKEDQARYEAARKAYSAYRTSFNAALARFEKDMGIYTDALRTQASR